MSSNSDISFTKEDLESLGSFENEGRKNSSKNINVNNDGESMCCPCNQNSEEEVNFPMKQQIEYLTNTFKIMKEILNSPVNNNRSEIFDFNFVKEEDILQNKNLLNDIINEK